MAGQRSVVLCLGFLSALACGTSSTNDTATDGGTDGSKSGTGGSGGATGGSGGSAGNGGATGGNAGSGVIGGAGGASGGSTGGSAGAGGAGGTGGTGFCPKEGYPGQSCRGLGNVVCPFAAGVCSGDLQCVDSTWVPTPSWTCPCGPNGLDCTGNTICVESAGGPGVSHACIVNPCVKEELSCSCAASVCAAAAGYECSSVIDLVVYCSCPSCL